MTNIVSDRCAALSSRVEGLCGLLLAYEFALVGLVFARPVRPGADVFAILVALAASWLLWLAVQVANYRLVKCGRQAVRYSLAPSFVNRPGYLTRAGFHLIINWSVIVVTLVVAQRLNGIAISSYLAGVAGCATSIVWLTFNYLHRRMNRGRNLLLSSAIAVSLVAASVLLLITD